MKTNYDSSLREVHFQVGDHVLLRLQPHHQTSIAVISNKKLSPQYYGPFEVIERWVKLLINYGYQNPLRYTRFFMSHA